MSRFAMVVALLICGCGGSTPEADEPDDGTSSLLGAGDRCPMLIGCHSDVEAGCSDPFFEFLAESDELLPRTVVLLESLATEIKNTPQLRSLRIQGMAGTDERDAVAASRAARIRDWLVEAGVSGRMLDVATEQTSRDDSTYATLEVVDCAGAGASGESDAAAFSIILF